MILSLSLLYVSYADAPPEQREIILEITGADRSFADAKLLYVSCHLMVPELHVDFSANVYSHGMLHKCLRKDDFIVPDRKGIEISCHTETVPSFFHSEINDQVAVILQGDTLI